MCSRKTSNCTRNFMLSEVKNFPHRSGSHISSRCQNRSWSHLLDNISQFLEVSWWWGRKDIQTKWNPLECCDETRAYVKETMHHIQVSKQVRTQSSKEWGEKQEVRHAEPFVPWRCLPSPFWVAEIAQSVFNACLKRSQVYSPANDHELKSLH